LLRAKKAKQIIKPYYILPILLTDLPSVLHVGRLVSSGVARGGGSKWRHAPWGAGLGGAPAHFLQSFKNAF